MRGETKTSEGAARQARDDAQRHVPVLRFVNCKNLYSPVRIRSSPPQSEHETTRWVTSGSSFGREFGREFAMRGAGLNVVDGISVRHDRPAEVSFPSSMPGHARCEKN